MDYLKALGVTVASVLIVYQFMTLFVNKVGGVEKLQKARNLVADVVHFIEQTMDAPGPEKKQAAIELAKQTLALAGVVLPDSVIDLFIEAAVFAMNLILKKA